MFNPFMSHFPGNEKSMKLSHFLVLCANIVTFISCTSVLIIGPWGLLPWGFFIEINLVNSKYLGPKKHKLGIKQSGIVWHIVDETCWDSWFLWHKHGWGQYYTLNISSEIWISLFYMISWVTTSFQIGCRWPVSSHPWLHFPHGLYVIINCGSLSLSIHQTCCSHLFL